jgi:hypothetical protein
VPTPRGKEGRVAATERLRAALDRAIEHCYDDGMKQEDIVYVVGRCRAHVNKVIRAHKARTAPECATAESATPTHQTD